MPGENALAERYDVSRLTIRRSLELLQREGLVQRRQGAGTFAVEQGVQAAARIGRLNTLVAHLNEMGAGTRVQVLEFGYEQPSLHIRTQLELPEGQTVQKACAHSLLWRRAVFVPGDICARGDRPPVYARRPGNSAAAGHPEEAGLSSSGLLNSRSRPMRRCTPRQSARGGDRRAATVYPARYPRHGQPAGRSAGSRLQPAAL